MLQVEDVRALLENNLQDVRRRVAEAAARSGRVAEAVTLVAVTKTVDAGLVRMLWELGASDIGENRLQEAQAKATQLADCGIRWHMVGHLQTNKARAAVRLFSLIHSVDSPRLAQALQKRAAQDGLTVTVLIEVNTSGETSKFGAAPDAAAELTQTVDSCEHLHLRGLMTMAPIVERAEDTRPRFRRLRELRDTINDSGRLRRPLTELSMGMTQDFEVAVEEGATMVRIGSALFRGILT
jgi:hypothetical protein